MADKLIKQGGIKNTPSILLAMAALCQLEDIRLAFRRPSGLGGPAIKGYNWSLSHLYVRPSESFRHVKRFHHPAMQDPSKNSFLWHHAISGVVVDGAAVMTLLTDMGHL